MCLSLLLSIILILSIAKKAIELSFCSRFKIYVLVVSTLAFAFKIIRPIIFSAVKKVSFPQSRKFCAVKELFHSQGNFPQFKEIFHNQRILPLSWKFSTIKRFFHSRGNFLQTKFLHSQKVFWKQRSKSFSKS